MKAACLLALACSAVAGCTLTPDADETLHSLPTTVPAPADNPTTPAAVALGRMLFWDPILSGNRDVACATCHHPSFGYADGLPVSVGVGGKGIGPVRATTPGASHAGRNAMTVLGAAFNGLTLSGSVPPEQAPMFWDHRTQSLESQVLGPMRSAVEMRGNAYAEDQIVDEVVLRLAGVPEYVSMFHAAFGDDAVTAIRMAKAIAAFERTLAPTDSSFDRYLRGDDSAMSASQVRGMHGFIAQGCAKCHSGPMLSDFKLHRLPVPPRPGETMPDPGGGGGVFRTPSLRNVNHTGPYMHNGVFKSLDEVLDFYHNIEVTDPLLANDVEPAHGQGDDIRAFFDALSDGTFDTTVPAKVPSGLPPGG